MSDDKNTRMNKFEKRRKNTKLITYLVSIGIVLFITLLGIWIFGGSEDDTPADLSENEDDSYFLDTEENNEQTESASEEDNQDVNNRELESAQVENQEEVEEDESEESNEEDEEYDIEHVETEDDNVISAYKADWPAIGTTQTGPHTTDFTEGSVDRIEIKEAVSYVTEIPEDEIVEIWVGNDGPERVVATVSDTDFTENFRVYLEWIDEEGWQPNKVEVLRDLEY